MHMICSSMPIDASTELTEFLYISCRKKLPFGVLSAGAGAYAPYPSLPAATVLTLADQRRGQGCHCYNNKMTIHWYIIMFREQKMSRLPRFSNYICVPLRGAESKRVECARIGPLIDPRHRLLDCCCWFRLDDEAKWQCGDRVLVSKDS